ncbi:YfcC family protein [Flaviramulus sp. BrNp1-15]|uniref:YfcC family protein n=1 Tax=Flaviramulus sp. BrNp1-15 TaxID=2916754 RepID=UPI001EE7ACC9|nr:YfcC family protein [Flaviramulus sp. BrNp1-15]ULC59083.1 YfcC family protein [Flaviramulus sp. BrNp1-15]
MKKLKFPTAQTILLIIAAMVALLTWVIPSGKFDTLAYSKDTNSFTINSQGKTTTIEATQASLDNLQIKIPLEKFTNGDIWKPIGIPNTYKKVEANPQGMRAFIMSPVKGIIEAADIIILVLFIGGLIGIVNNTGAFEGGISWLSKALEGKEFLLIIIVTFLVAIGGTTFGLAEETIAFFPILIPVFIAAKYDALVGLACIFIGSAIGTMASTINPFSTIIASDAAGINWTTGLYGRLIMFFLSTSICIIYILRYAQKVKSDPSKSIIFDQKEEIESLFSMLKTDSAKKLTTKLKLVLFVFTLCFIVMIYGVSMLDWWFIEMTSTFLVGAILIGIIVEMNETKFVDQFVKGATDLLGVAFIIGIARGVTILMNDGLISDTLLYYSSDLTNGMNKGLFANMMTFIYSCLSFFIPSSSGMAVLTMPIMSPLADGVGVGREIVVNAYQYGMGLFYFINPTGLILASLAIVKVGFDKWLKFVIPLVVILIVVTMLFMTTSVYI